MIHRSDSWWYYARRLCLSWRQRRTLRLSPQTSDRISKDHLEGGLSFCPQAARRFEDTFPDIVNCSSSSPFRTAVIKVSITACSLSSDATAIAAFPFRTRSASRLARSSPLSELRHRCSHLRVPHPLLAVEVLDHFDRGSHGGGEPKRVAADGLSRFRPFTANSFTKPLNILKTIPPKRLVRNGL